MRLLSKWNMGEREIAKEKACIHGVSIFSYAGNSEVSKASCSRLYKCLRKSQGVLDQAAPNMFMQP